MSEEARAADALTNAWRRVNHRKTPIILRGDEAVLEYGNNRSSDRFAQDPLLLDPGKQFFLNLIPAPYTGPIRTASVYLLLLNPGFSSLDLFAEEREPKLRRRLIRNLSGNTPNLSFDPKFHWTGGFRWTLSKFRKLIDVISTERRLYTPKEKLDFFANQIAILELVPYHSPSFPLSPTEFNNLQSVELMKDFVEKFVIPRAKADECTVVITRKVKEWGVGRGKNVILYGPGEARGAHISPQTRGGKAILKRLRRVLA